MYVKYKKDSRFCVLSLRSGHACILINGPLETYQISSNSGLSNLEEQCHITQDRTLAVTFTDFAPICL